MHSEKNLDRKFETRNKNLLDIWNEIQCVQTDFCFSQEISAYYMSGCWLKTAKSIIDIGTGNGYFLKMLSGLFPGKSYTGIDISKELIAIAKKNLQGSGIRLKVQDYFDVDGQFDFVIMRLFWQHLPLNRMEEALTKLERLTIPGSNILISDSWDRARCFVPDLPEFHKIISAYTNQQIKNDRDRNIIERLLKWSEQSPKWKVACDLKIIIPSTIGGNLGLYQRAYDLWIDLFECIGELEVDFTAAKNELKNWKKEKSSFTQAGLRVIRIERVI